MELFRCRKDAAGHWVYEGAGADRGEKPEEEQAEQHRAVSIADPRQRMLAGVCYMESQIIKTLTANCLQK